ncbi:M14 family metallopeptidase [Brevifollis gellanilyticus]|uniref:Peptidase M14 n=1 Tax=Brevifollis gellanilyticus TaxID=748831 RepID=A0A512MF65_9BACT|nr:M14 family metallopeptidase [Brevifollis gellanilyticus]GEP45358.1 peptidase M14 [Brevifollis gellanilyticus]
MLPPAARSVLLTLACLLMAVSCRRQEAEKPQQWSFSEEGVTFSADFPRARLTECKRLAQGEYDLAVRPEDLPVNNSPWFAFKVTATKETSIVAHLRCIGGTLRYRPKISTDGNQWVMLPEEAFTEGPQEHECTLKLEVGPNPLWVAAQEPVSTAEMKAWGRTLERLPFVTMSEFGKSIRGTALWKLDIGKADAKRHVSIIGRQHPPETTGSLALMRFIEELAGDSEMARKFRDEFHVLVIPLMNPDGVDAGHWRHNLGHVDLNRDWGPFVQPETKAASEQISALKDKGRIFLHLDFHSTFNDVFYTPPDDAPANPPMFAATWLDRLQKRVPTYKVNREASHTPKTVTSAYWAHKTFVIPGITYEIGDNTDRATLKLVASAAAQEMMALLMELKDTP